MIQCLLNSKIYFLKFMKVENCLQIKKIQNNSFVKYYLYCIGTTANFNLCLI